jgi:transposase
MKGKGKIMGGRTAPGTKRKNKPGKKQLNRVLELINLNAAGIDAGKEEHYVSIPEDRTTPSVRRFMTTTRQLFQLADWLVEHGIETVAVEATGLYCTPLLEVLDARGLDVVLAKPSSLKSVNDRQKSDMMDCQWIQLLHTFGLLKGSYRPTQEIAEYRTYNRQRQMLIQQASTSIEHIKKALTSMNVRIDLAVTDVTGKTGMSIIRAILDGERDPVKLARMRDERCAKSEAQIAEALFGKYSADHLFELDQAVRTWDHFQVLIKECNVRLEQQAQQMVKKSDRKDIPKARRIEHVRKNVLAFEARELFFEVLGQDLTQIDGISTGTVSVFLAEVGSNLDAFSSVKKFTSWLRVCPGKNRTGGKDRSGKNRTTANRLTLALRVAAQTLHRSNSALGAFYRRMRARLGPEQAIEATAHKLARMIYFTLTTQRPFVDPGPDHYTEKHKKQVLKRMEKRAQQLGYKLVAA